MEVPKFYIVDQKAPWGDCGMVLTCRGEDLGAFTDNIPVKIRRTGPFMPPITFPYRCVVSDSFKELLHQRFAYLEFAEAVKKHIVELHWDKWDRSGELQQYPNGAEPESYLRGRHSVRASKQLGKIWCVQFPIGAKTWISPSRDFVIDPATWSGTDFFQTVQNDYTAHLVTEVGREFLEQHAGEWVSFRDALSDTGGSMKLQIPTGATEEPASAATESGGDIHDLLDRIIRCFAGCDS